jgi:IS5 family transposase
MNQMSCSDFEYVSKRKQPRHERFLAEIARVALWSGLLALIEPYFPKVGDGRKLYLWSPCCPIRLLQNWFFLK